jgi:hypothetical protein
VCPSSRFPRRCRENAKSIRDEKSPEAVSPISLSMAGKEPPGLASKMNPRPDHGEKSYQGFGRLAGRKALITGGDS